MSTEFRGNPPPNTALIFEQIKQFVKTYTNDQELGEIVRQYIKRITNGK